MRLCPGALKIAMTATAGSDVVQSGRPIFNDFFQHLWPYIVAAVAEWYRYRTVVCFVTGSSPVPLKTRRLEIQRAYHHIPIHPADRRKTALVTNFGTFEFVFMQFGLCNAAQTWMRFIHELLRGLGYCFVYVDDILIASTNANSDKKRVREVLQRIDDFGLTINASKCMFGCFEVRFVGYLVNKDGILPLPEKVALIANYKQPTTVRDLRKAHHSQDADLALMIDASDFSFVASLNEITSNGSKPLGFFSKQLTPAQTKYSAFDRELLAPYSAIKYFRHMIEGHILILYTDHKLLTFAFNQKLDKASPRQLPT
ncbi:hypothetical protein TNCV_4115021 [Trichonephila clavipes]|nr:hypothetical protein TNCV_4115021 [Trichonephila clavipes]